MRERLRNLLDNSVRRILASAEQRISAEVDATRAKVMADVARFDRQITEHLAQLEDETIRMLHRCEKDSLLSWEKEAALRSVFRKAKVN
jgi:gamma-glutamylcyclotransferase (GGCT)/AIG2-like uncharacterized protein YtfP